MVWGPGGLGGARWCLGFKDKDTEDIPLGKSTRGIQNGIRAPRASIKPLAERLHLQLGRPSPPNKKDEASISPTFLFLFYFVVFFFFRSRGFVVFFWRFVAFFSHFGQLKWGFKPLRAPAPGVFHQNQTNESLAF